MDRELAQMIAASATRAGVELSDLVPLLKVHCEPEIYETFAMAIGRVLSEIHFELEQRIFEMYPDIKEEFEARVNKYGRLSY